MKYIRLHLDKHISAGQIKREHGIKGSLVPICILTPHIAGSFGDEVQRMAIFMEDSFAKYARKEPDPCEVTLEMLQTMA